MAPGVLAAQRRDAMARAQRAFGELVQERGYDSVTLADVAVRAGMARTSMYNYYRTKESLLVDSAVVELDRFTTQLRGTLSRTPDPRDQLRTFGRRLIEQYERGALPSAAALRPIVSADTFDRIAEHTAVLDDMLQQILTAGAAAAVFDPGAVADARTAPLVMACFSRDPRDPATPRTPEGGVDEVVDATLEFVMRALGARS